MPIRENVAKRGGEEEKAEEEEVQQRAWSAENILKKIYSRQLLGIVVGKCMHMIEGATKSPASLGANCSFA